RELFHDPVGPPAIINFDQAPIIIAAGTIVAEWRLALLVLSATEALDVVAGLLEKDVVKELGRNPVAVLFEEFNVAGMRCHGFFSFDFLLHSQAQMISSKVLHSWKRGLPTIIRWLKTTRWPTPMAKLTAHSASARRIWQISMSSSRER